METKPTASHGDVAAAPPNSIDLTELRDRIAQWRSVRARGTRMPEELWSAAVALAGEHGVWRVAQSVRVCFETLKSRLQGTDQSDTSAASAEPRSRRAGFVEVVLAGAADASSSSGHRRIGSVPLSPPASSCATSIELSSVTGARLVINLGTDSRVEIESLAAALGRLAQ